MKRSVWSVLVLVLMMAGVVFAVSCAVDVAEGGRLVVAISEPSFIDPTLAYESEGIQVDNALFDPLLRYDPKTLAIVPCVAETYEVNEDATVWTFHLKKGTSFHNGREVVAGDFKYAWERLSSCEVASPYGFLLGMIEGYQDYWDGNAEEITGINVVDDYTLEVTMAESFAEFDYIVAFNDTAPIPEEEVEGKEEAFALMPIGNGPFKMTEPWAAGQYIRLDEFSGYNTAAKPLIDGVEFKIYTDLKTAWTDFEAGAVDSARIPPGNYASAAATYGLSVDGDTANPGVQVQNGSELSVSEILFNTTDPIMQNKDLRIACSLAINRQVVCDVVWEGTRIPADSAVPPGVDGYESGAFAYCKYDVDEAKAALARAGYPNGEGLPALKLCFIAGAGQDEAMQLVKSDLGAIGINVVFDTTAGPTYWPKLEEGGFQIGLSGWQCDYPSVDNCLFPLYGSTGFLNYSNYSNPKVDEALAAARVMLDKDERIAAYQEIVKTIGEDCPDTIIGVATHGRVASSRVHDLTCSAMGLLDFNRVWIRE